MLRLWFGCSGTDSVSGHGLDGLGPQAAGWAHICPGCVRHGGVEGAAAPRGMFLSG